MLANPVAGVDKMVSTVGKYQPNKNHTEGEPSAAQLIFQLKKQIEILEKQVEENTSLKKYLESLSEPTNKYPEWTTEEHKKFLKAMEIYANESAGSDFHLKIAQFVGNRQPLDVKVHIQDHFLQLRQSIQSHENLNPWTNAENKIFENILGEYFSKPNSSIASIPWDEMIIHFPSRTVEDIRKHYQKLSYDVTQIAFGIAPMLEYSNQGKNNGQGGGGQNGPVGSLPIAIPPQLPPSASVLVPSGNENKSAAVPGGMKDPQRMIKHTLSEQTLLNALPASASLSSRNANNRSGHQTLAALPRYKVDPQMNATNPRQSMNPITISPPPLLPTNGNRFAYLPQNQPPTHQQPPQMAPSQQQQQLQLQHLQAQQMLQQNAMRGLPTFQMAPGIDPNRIPFSYSFPNNPNMQNQGGQGPQGPPGGGNYIHQTPMMPVNMIPQSNQYFHASQLQQNLVEQPRTRMSIYELPQNYNQSASLSKYLTKPQHSPEQQQNNFKHPSVLPRKELPTSPLQRLAPTTAANAPKQPIGNPALQQKVGNMQSPPNFQNQSLVQSIQPPPGNNAMNPMNNNLQNHMNPAGSETYYSNPANTASNFNPNQMQPPNSFASNPAANNNFRNPQQQQQQQAQHPNNPLELSNTPTPPQLSRTPPNPFPPSPAPPVSQSTEPFYPFSDFLAEDQSEDAMNSLRALLGDDTFDL